MIGRWWLPKPPPWFRELSHAVALEAFYQYTVRNLVLEGYDGALPDRASLLISLAWAEYLHGINDVARMFEGLAQHVGGEGAVL